MLTPIEYISEDTVTDLSRLQFSKVCRCLYSTDQRRLTTVIWLSFQFFNGTPTSSLASSPTTLIYFFLSVVAALAVFVCAICQSFGWIGYLFHSGIWLLLNVFFRGYPYLSVLSMILKDVSRWNMYGVRNGSWRASCSHYQDTSRSYHPRLLVMVRFAFILHLVSDEHVSLRRSGQCWSACFHWTCLRTVSSPIFSVEVLSSL